MQPDTLKAKGITVHKSFYPHQEPVVTHRIFELKYSGPAAMVLSIDQVRVLAEGEIIPIESFFLYLLPDYDELDPSRIELAPSSTSQFEVSFPSFSAVPYLNQDIEIELSLEVAGETVSVRSPYQISRRTPKRR